VLDELAGPFISSGRLAAAQIVTPRSVRAGGSGVGIRAGVIFLIDDLVPSLFGKPIFR
jgi:hypothetical protein